MKPLTPLIRGLRILRKHDRSAVATSQRPYETKSWVVVWLHREHPPFKLRRKLRRLGWVQYAQSGWRISL